MKPFRATYTPSGNKESRIVLIVAFLPALDWKTMYQAVFVDADNSLKSASFECFTNCQMDWRGD